MTDFCLTVSQARITVCSNKTARFILRYLRCSIDRLKQHWISFAAFPSKIAYRLNCQAKRGNKKKIAKNLHGKQFFFFIKMEFGVETNNTDKPSLNSEQKFRS